MGDYVDWDYSESIGGVPASLIAYSGTASRKRRGALQGFDTTYGSADDTALSVLQAKVDDLSKQLTQVKTLQQQFTVTQGTNYIANGDFSQWSTVNNVLATTYATGTSQSWKLSGTCIPCADRWYTFAETCAFTGLTATNRVESRAYNPTITKTPGSTGAYLKSTKAIQVDWSTTGTTSLYNGGDNKDKSSAVLGIQHLVQNAALWANRRVTLDFYVACANVSTTAFVQVCRQYHLNRATPSLTNMRVFSNGLQPPGLEVIFREQITIPAGGTWQRYQKTFDLGPHTITGAWGPDGEHGLLIQMGPLYYINTKDSGNNTVIQQWGSGGGTAGLFAPGGGKVSWLMSDVMLYDGDANGAVVMTLRDESQYTLPWVSTYGPRYKAHNSVDGFIIDAGAVDTVNRAITCKIPFPMRMARAPSNVIIGFSDGLPDAFNLHLSRDHLLGSSGQDRSWLSKSSMFTNRTRFPWGLNGFCGITWGISHNHALTGADATQLVPVNGTMTDAMDPTNGSNKVSLLDANQSQAFIGINPINATSNNGYQLWASMYSNSPSQTISSQRGWFVFYARDTDWGSTSPTDAVNTFDHLNSAVTSIPFPITAIN